MKILVAEDDEALRNLYKQVLESANFKVDVAKDGEQALSLLQRGGYDLVLLDIHMPKIDGITAVGMLKKTPPVTPNGPIYFLTNDNDATTMAEGVTLDVRGYLVKSQYTPKDLVTEVNRILDLEKNKTA